ncbi:MAG: class I SAM-dependent methyltransferase [Erysipelotrichaceae bacterium]|nr:class I SAM-dependent methyltransferase [Erysipelotrichaceae bacterium]
MSKKNEVIAFFDRLSAGWDSHMVRNERAINRIIDNGRVRENMNVLDVACGTGVLIPDYLKRNVNSVTAIDISKGMTDIAAAKFADEEKVEVVCGDVMEYCPDKKFDCIVVYNALPHFESPEELIKKLAGLLETDGCLTIAHGMSFARLSRHHDNVSEDVSNPLTTAWELADIMSRYLKVTVVVSDDEMYQVAGVKE